MTAGLRFGTPRPADPQDPPAGGALAHPNPDLAFQRGTGKRCAQSQFAEAHRNADRQVITAASEHLVGLTAR